VYEVEDEKEVEVSISLLTQAYQRIYQSYPRRVGKPKALAEIAKAIEREGKIRGRPEAVRYVEEQTAKYAQCPYVKARLGTQDEDKIPHPSTWFNRDGFNDEADWGKSNHGTNQPAGSIAKHQAVRDHNAAAVGNLRRSFGIVRANEDPVREAGGRAERPPVAGSVIEVPTGDGEGGA
jgi:hypothetical protein